MYRLYRAQLVVMFAIFGASVPVAVVASLREHDRTPLLFVLIWVAVLCWTAYWFLGRLCHRLELDEGVLVWSAPLRSGRAPLPSLRALRPARLGLNIAAFEFADGTHVLVPVRRGFAPFAAAVRAAAPQAAVRINWYTRLVERLPGFSGFRSGGGM